MKFERSPQIVRCLVLTVNCICTSMYTWEYEAAFGLGKSMKEGRSRPFCFQRAVLLPMLTYPLNNARRPLESDVRAKCYHFML